jgi:hypothetical protein
MAIFLPFFHSYGLGLSSTGLQTSTTLARTGLLLPNIPEY